MSQRSRSSNESLGRSGDSVRCRASMGLQWITPETGRRCFLLATMDSFCKVLTYNCRGFTIFSTKKVTNLSSFIRIDKESKPIYDQTLDLQWRFRLCPLLPLCLTLLRAAILSPTDAVQLPPRTILGSSIRLLHFLTILQLASC